MIWMRILFCSTSKFVSTCMLSSASLVIDPFFVTSPVVFTTFTQGAPALISIVPIAKKRKLMLKVRSLLVQVE